MKMNVCSMHLCSYVICKFDEVLYICVIHACDKFLAAEFAEIMKVCTLYSFKLNPHYACTYSNYAYLLQCLNILKILTYTVTVLHIKQNSRFYTVTLAYKTSLILQPQGVRRAWIGDYDTLPQFI